MQTSLSQWLLSAATALVLLLSGCAATVERTAPPTSSAPADKAGLSTDASAAPATSANALPTLGIAAASAQKLVVNFVLEPPHPKDSGWKSFVDDWMAICKEQAAAQKVSFASQEGEPKPTNEAGTLVVVRVKDYKVVGIGMRVMFGVFTGNAYIEAKAEFRDLATGKLLGERDYNTRSSAMHGVFAAMTPKQMYAVADEILREMKQR